MWLADHDLDIAGEVQISLYSGRGIYSESQGPVWMVGTGECPIGFPDHFAISDGLFSLYVFFFISIS